MKKEKTITDNLNKVKKSEKGVARLKAFLKTSSGQKFVNNIHKERIDVLCKRYHLNYIVYTNLTITMNVISSVLSKLGMKPENNAKKAVEELTEQHHPQPKRLTLHTRKIEKDGHIEKVKSECSKLNTINDRNMKLTHKELLNGYKAHKLDKWLMTNPEPIEQDSTGQLNLFYETNHEEWRKKLDLIKIRIEDYIIKKYNPYVQLKLYYYKNLFTNAEIKHKKTVYVYDPENSTRNVRYIEKNSKINILASKEIYNAFLKDKKNFACGFLYDHDNRFCKQIHKLQSDPFIHPYIYEGEDNGINIHKMKNPLFKDNKVEKVIIPAA